MRRDPVLSTWFVYISSCRFLEHSQSRASSRPLLALAVLRLLGVHQGFRIPETAGSERKRPTHVSQTLAPVPCVGHNAIYESPEIGRMTVDLQMRQLVHDNVIDQ